MGGRKVDATRRSSILMGQVPMVPFKLRPESKDYQWMDIYNALGRQRTLFVSRFLDDEACNQLIASLVYLQGQNAKDPITMYFNVPGAILKPSFAVYDTMRRMTCPLVTINMGLTVGMGSLLCAVGTKGQRYAFPNARFLMSKTGLEDGLEGQAVGLGHAVREVMRDNEKVVGEFARLCGHAQVKVEEDLRRDFYLTAGEAAAYGVIDMVLRPSQPVKMSKYRGVDDAKVYFGHFSEARPLMTGPNDKIVQLRSDNEDEYDENIADQMAEMGYDPKNPLKSNKDRKARKNEARFANSRLRPPGVGRRKPKKPKSGDGEGGGGDDTDSGGNKYRNSGWG
eukprot:CAMPEP_0182424148 /NCGR_PEP_ID=MMETSP1167-20130531/10305_1 /TAXON_ID=2988 /ORGANISM="Mallomonas Sp, Strain CCMP3275" /LENGTH=337 /DNA_ID=CAMNT_0024603721 /DNA_START=184 /DNA_END=1197 /DNA_ORIENTATION=-